MRTFLALAVLGLMTSQSLAADAYCNWWVNSAGVEIDFGAPREDQATVTSGSSVEVCDIDTGQSPDEPWGYVETLDCGNGPEVARMFISEGERHPSSVEFRGSVFACFTLDGELGAEY